MIQFASKMLDRADQFTWNCIYRVLSRSCFYCLELFELHWTTIHSGIVKTLKMNKSLISAPEYFFNNFASIPIPKFLRHRFKNLYILNVYSL